MSVRVNLDLEPGVAVSRVLSDLDLLDVVYGAARAGAGALIIPMSALVGPQAISLALFDRPALPMIIVKCEEGDFDRIPNLGSTPDRILLTADRGRPNPDLSRATDMIARITSTGQEVGVLIDPEVAHLKEAARLKCRWAYFPTDNAYRATNSGEADDEIARICTASLAANRLGMRVGAIGPMGRHLSPALSEIPHLEELCPSSDLWISALRVGWDRALDEFRRQLS